MKHISYKIVLLLLLFLSMHLFCSAQSDDKIMIVIIDGARYSETLGDLSKTYTPEMWELSKQGSVLDNFQNDNYTYTSRAIPALWCGAWTEIGTKYYNGKTSSYAVLPTIFEYYRKQKNMSAEECFYILPYIPNLWLPSFDADYGPDYWPDFHSVGNNDKDVATQTQLVMDTYHPHFMLVYLVDVDHAGHSGNWTNYTNTIQRADSIVGVLWQKIQSDPFYKNTTTLIVTNDHGRHDDQHGGFQSHGCGCEGCRHIEFLTLGPNIKKNYKSTAYHATPDMAVTVAHVLDIEPTKSTGNIIQEIFETTGIENDINQNSFIKENFPNPFNENTRIEYFLSEPSNIQISIFNIKGEKIVILTNEWQTQGEQSIEWNATDMNGNKVESGIYFVRIQVDNQAVTKKLVYLPEIITK